MGERKREERRLTDDPLPCRAYIPGASPRPDPESASHQPHDPFPALWQVRRGAELFNHGFYWEAHEAWERLWIALDRRGPHADYCKGLIKLAAAGVKARQGNPVGVQRHSRRARDLFLAAAQSLAESHEATDLQTAALARLLAEQSQLLADAPEKIVDATPAAVRRVMPFTITPHPLPPERR